MPRNRKPAKGELGRRVERAMLERGLNPQALAAAARVHKGTLYHILQGKTRHPHHSTLRRICKILQLDLAELIGAEQLEIFGLQLERAGVLSELEELLLAEIRTFTGQQMQAAAEVAVLAMLKVKLGMGRGASTHIFDEIRGAETTLASGFEELVIGQAR
ncbi:MAG: helix-turn-helix domain-containing protein, partial [Thioalkalivibrio sp.]|nr:helix-turn-helix domain-containing protein [Thioalkalivibrio sp.]